MALISAARRARRWLELKSLIECAALAAAYIALARLSLSVDEVSPYLSALWPASGLALAVSLEFGRRVLPGVFLGSALYLWTLGLPWEGCLLFGAANSFEAGVASWALDRIGIDGHSFYDPRDFSIFGVVTGSAAAMGSLLAVWTLHRFALIRVGSFDSWATRSLGHWAAMLIVAPAILLWRHHSRLTGGWKYVAEGAALAAATTAAVAVLFGGGAVSARHLSFDFALMLVAVWAAARFGVRETSTVLLVIAFAGSWGTLRGFGPFAGAQRDVAVDVLQAFVSTLALASMTLSSAIWRAKDDREQARQARAKLALITDAAPALIAYIDPQWRYAFVNGAYRRWRHSDPASLLGRRVDEILTPEVYETCRPRLAEAFAGRPVEFEARFPYSGELRWVAVSYRPDLLPNGTVAGVVALVTDISRQKAAEETLRETERRVVALNRELSRRVERRTARLRQVNAELESFCYAVAHDLRSPLRKMSGFSQAVLQDYGDCLGAGGVDQLKRIFDASRRMARLIDDMLTLTAVTRRDMAEELVDLSAMTRRVVERLQAADPERRVELVVEPEVRARADPELLETALRHLLDNAWKFTSKRPEARIEFGVIPQEPSPIYFVRDDGVGFDESQRRKLFASYERLHADFPGHGLGLATVSRVIQRHGGRIWAEGEPGRGATFYFTLHDRE